MFSHVTTMYYKRTINYTNRRVSFGTSNCKRSYAFDYLKSRLDKYCHLMNFKEATPRFHENSMRDGRRMHGADKGEEPRFKNTLYGAREGKPWVRYEDEGQNGLPRQTRCTSCTKGKGREQMKEKLLMVSAPWHRLYLPHVQSPVWSEYTDRSSLVRVHICSFAHPSFPFFYFLSSWILGARQRENCPLVEERNWSFRIPFLSRGKLLLW